MMKTEVQNYCGLKSLTVGIIILFLTMNLSGIISAAPDSGAERVSCNLQVSEESDNTITCQYRNMTLIK